jgi:hypothetical protein
MAIEMTRLRLFAALGPLLAWLYCIAFLAARTDGPIFEDGRYWLPSLMVCYAFSILPMLFTAWVDRRLSDRWWRSLACGLAGFGIAFVLYYGLTHDGPAAAEHAKMFQRDWFYVGLVWGLPAVVCSWVMGLDRKESVDAR